MSVSFENTTVDSAFFTPLNALVAQSQWTRPCPELPDLDFVRLGIHRVLESSPSGRGFIQEHGARFERMPTHSNYFSTLRSARRGELLKDVHDRLIAAAAVLLPDRLNSLPELRTYECFAADGHWHQAATHDPRHDGVKMAVGHFYSLDLRSHTLRHLAAAEGLHEHDMSVLKRVKPKGLRQSVPKGKRVLIVYDKAGIDFAYWKRCRQECALYFLSRVKEAMVYDWLADRDWASSDPRNAGVKADRRVMTREGVELRIVTYIDPVGGESYEFLTNEPDLPPGIIVELYRRRWEAEKVFDEIKNKLGERKAWGTTPGGAGGAGALRGDDPQSAEDVRTPTGGGTGRAQSHRGCPAGEARSRSGGAVRTPRESDIAPDYCCSEGHPVQCEVRPVDPAVLERRRRGSRRRRPATHPLRSVLRYQGEHRWRPDQYRRMNRRCHRDSDGPGRRGRWILRRPGFSRRAARLELRRLA